MKLLEERLANYQPAPNVFYINDLKVLQLMPPIKKDEVIPPNSTFTIASFTKEQKVGEEVREALENTLVGGTTMPVDLSKLNENVTAKLPRARGGPYTNGDSIGKGAFYESKAESRRRLPSLHKAGLLKFHICEGDVTTFSRFKTKICRTEDF